MSRKILVGILAAALLVAAGGSLATALFFSGRPAHANGVGGATSAQVSVQSPPPLSLAFAGDIMAHAINSAHPPYSAIYTAVEAELKGPALTFGNLELTVDDELPVAGYPLFNVHSEYVQAAVDAGFNVFSVANNHSGDYGAPGIRATYGALDRLRKSAGISFAGIRETPDLPFTPITIESEGWRIGFLAITQLLNRREAAPLVDLVDYRNPPERSAFLDRLKAVAPGYDLLILSVHGGVEYSPEPDPVKESFLRDCIAAGATIVWSHHPHVLGPWEIDSVGGRRGLILYSNGNFVSGQISEIDPHTPGVPRAATGDSALFRVRVEKGQSGAEVVDVHPFLISNYRTVADQMVVRPLAELATAPLPAVWHGYYAARYEAVRRIARGGELTAQGVLSPLSGFFAAQTAIPEGGR